MEKLRIQKTGVEKYMGNEPFQLFNHVITCNGTEYYILYVASCCKSYIDEYLLLEAVSLRPCPGKDNLMLGSGHLLWDGKANKAIVVNEKGEKQYVIRPDVVL